MINRLALLVSGDIFLAISAIYAVILLGIQRQSASPGTQDILLFTSITLFTSYFIELYSPNIISLLINYKADLNLRDIDGNTALIKSIHFQQKRDWQLSVSVLSLLL